jgi:hypothetical protein
MRIRLLVALTAALAGGVVVVSSARADGDPASDVLIGQKVFFPYAGGSVSGSDKAALASVVDQANTRGMRIRVAVIAGPYDLGSVTALWRKPRTYAKFLGGELTFVYKKGLLMTVMPQGFGLFRGTPAQQATLNRIRTGQSADALVRAATTGVSRLAAARGIKVAPVIPTSGSSSWKTIVIAAGGVAILALLGLITYLYVRGPRERAATRESR